MILELHHVQIPIPPGSEPQAREFYCGVMGLPEVPKPESLAGRGGFWLQIADRQVHVGADANAHPENSKAHVAYLVDDLATWTAKLGPHGMKFEEGVPIPGYVRVESRDPFGNRIEFLQRIND